MNLYDIVIPVGPSDSEQINSQLNFTTKNIIGYRNIYLICYDPSIKIENKEVIIVDEKLFPFRIIDIQTYHSKYDRNSWYLQQLLKLYSGIIIPGILDRYLVIDADTYFLKPTVFVKENKCLYNTSNENHLPYFQHMLKLHPSMEKQLNESGICHHMVFEKSKIEQLFSMVEKYNSNKKFWQIFLEKVNPEHYGMTYINMSGASEYEIYLNYVLKYYREEIQIRKLKWTNIDKNPENYTNEFDYDYVSWHYFMRE